MHVLPTVVPLAANLVSACVSFLRSLHKSLKHFPQRPSYHAQGWTISDHPEGKRYAHSKAQAGITIVTEARVADPGVSDQLNAWVAVICDMITEEKVQLQETSQLFLEVHEDTDTCNYYFADHGLRTVFWLRAVETIGVRPPHFFSSTHLRMFLKYLFTLLNEPIIDTEHSLEENYWIHVELFPETASQYSAIALDEILVTFLHARAGKAVNRLFTHAPGSDTLHLDALTSKEPIVPTFLYTAVNERNQDIIELLQRSQGVFDLIHLTLPSGD